MPTYSTITRDCHRMAAAKEYSSRATTCKKVLIVEDDYSIRQMMKDVLELEGFAVATAVDGSEGFAVLKALPEAPCAIILDLMMPGTNGWRFLDLVRNDPNFAQIPIIICSAFSETAKTVHADAIVEKPIQLDRLLSAIQHFCD